MRQQRIGVFLMALGLWGLATGAGFADERSVAEEILDILRANDQITQQQYDTLLAKANNEKASLPAVTAEKVKWYDRITFFGDARGRWESFWFDHDPLGEEKGDFHRIRTRIRVGLKTKINDYIDFKMRMATGTGRTSRNQTLGDTTRWDPHDLMLDYSYLTFHPSKEAIPFGGRQLDLKFGKMPNPFRSKVGKDMIIWDSDLTPEGIALDYAVDVTEELSLSLHSAFFILEENETSTGHTNDPHVAAVQLRAEKRASEKLSFGTNLSYYQYGSLNTAFYQGNDNHGNVENDGSNFGLSSGNNIRISDVRAWMRCTGNEDWPFLLYGNFAHNYSAVNTTGFNTGKEDDAWSVGAELGSKKKIVKLGAAYFWVQANAVPEDLMDADLFEDGPNAKGWMFYGSRQIFPHTDFNVTFFVSDPLDDGIRGFSNSPGPLLEKNRKRLQTDVVVKF